MAGQPRSSETAALPMPNLSNVSPELTLVGAINDAVTTITVSDNPVVAVPFHAVISPDPTKVTEEIVLVTNSVVNGGDYDLTITRAQQGTSAKSHLSAAIVAHVAVAADLRPTMSDTAPTNPTAGMKWWDSVTGKEYVWYVDGTSNQWVENMGAGSQGVVGNTGATGDFSSIQTIVADTASRSLALTDAGGLLTMDSTIARTYTIEQDSTVDFPIGTHVDMLALGLNAAGTGHVTIVQGTGATLRAPLGLILRSRYSVATAIKIAANTWLITGDLRLVA